MLNIKLMQNKTTTLPKGDLLPKALRRKGKSKYLLCRLREEGKLIGIGGGLAFLYKKYGK